MSKGTIYGILALLALVASIAMFIMKDNSHLSELKQFWWMPLILFGLFGAKAFPKKDKA